MPRWETGPDHVFWGPIVKCNIFQGTDTTVGDGFPPLGPPLLPWENRMWRGQTHTETDITTTRPNWPGAGAGARAVSVREEEKKLHPMAQTNIRTWRLYDWISPVGPIQWKLNITLWLPNMYVWWSLDPLEWNVGKARHLITSNKKNLLLDAVHPEHCLATDGQRVHKKVDTRRIIYKTLPSNPSSDIQMTYSYGVLHWTSRLCSCKL